MKMAKECRSDEKLAGNRSANDSGLQTNEEDDHSSLSPVPHPMKSASALVSPVPHDDQVQATLSSSSPSKESRYL